MQSEIPETKPVVFVHSQGMTMLILATDMARHGEIMESFKEKLASGFDFANKEHMDTVTRSP